MIGAGQDQNAQSLDQATQDLIQSFQQSNPGMQQSGGMKSINVNGTNGRSVTLLGNSPVQQNGKPLRERDWLVTVPDPQGRGLFYLVFIAPDKDFGQLVYANRLTSRGVVFVRFPAHARSQLGPTVSTAIEQAGARLRESFTVIQPGRVRISRDPTL